MVDNDPDIRDFFRIFLTRQGHTIHTVPGGKECIEILQTLTPDLIVPEIMMEPMDGWETLRIQGYS
ncbi:MAG: response regulator [Methanogenium sp.]|nr:response regulator [Methanogenium sp.]